MLATATIDGENAPTIGGTDAPVPWWSFTKTVLSVAALSLVDRGALDLDAPMEERPFTLRQLLRHEAGLPDYGSVNRYHEDVAAGKAPWPASRMLVAVQADRLRFVPGTGWAYSNIGYLMVAKAIETGSGLPLAAALSSLVFDPSRLQTARLAMSANDLVDVEMGGAAGYDPGWVYHGLVTGTAADAARLLHALMSGKLLQPSTLSAMLEGHPLPQHRSEAHPDPAYGLGVMLSATNPRLHPIGHTGEGPGSRIAVYALADRIAAVWTGLPAGNDAEKMAARLLACSPARLTDQVQLARFRKRTYSGKALRGSGLIVAKRAAFPKSVPD
ncbi:serine hydrolase domain-containing protein [Glacieibacterium megasporae]|uniref:serine hydrolase domain-containing protein n=1 Tax=Glacieibacterium megasporae TaxID=2835787 RepID=UPI001C1E31C4|nr:serine hydrolase domain-containing protein [Polymorphobacter megasporae]UAJ12677.1 beta-lactamase family protein [Polymorphobacter megasporae]